MRKTGLGLSILKSSFLFLLSHIFLRVKYNAKYLILLVSLLHIHYRKEQTLKPPSWSFSVNQVNTCQSPYFQKRNV